MKRFTIATLTFSLLTANVIHAQSSPQISKVSKNYVYSRPWSLGLGWGIIEDNGSKLRNLFNVHRSWNMMPFANILSCERDLPAGFNAEAAFTFDLLKAGNTVDQNGVGPNFQAPQNTDYYAIDISLKYNLHCFYDNTNFPVKPYILWGFGYCMIPFINDRRSFISNNLGLGFDVCFINIFKESQFLKPFFICFQTMGKFTNTSDNNLEHSITLLYRFK